MNITRNHERQDDKPPTSHEIAALTTRLRDLTGPSADPAARAAFLADKNALLARIPHPDPDTGTDTGGVR